MLKQVLYQLLTALQTPGENESFIGKLVGIILDLYIVAYRMNTETTTEFMLQVPDITPQSLQVPTNVAVCSTCLDKNGKVEWPPKSFYALVRNQSSKYTRLMLMRSVYLRIN